MEKAKREDFRVEEELRTQKVKYEEANDDVIRRMQDIKDAEVESVMDLGSFLEAQLEYHERCREALLQLRSEWPAGCSQAPSPPRRPTRARSNTAHSYQERYEPLQEELETVTESRPTIRSNRTASNYAADSPSREAYPASNGYARPGLNRTSTFESPTQLRQETSPAPTQWIQRTASDNMVNRRGSVQHTGGRYLADPYADSEASSYGRSSPERAYGGRSISPATSHGSVPSRRPSSTALNASSLAKKAPPPPPSRAKKPPPPPPPMKRSLVTVTDL